MAQLKLIASYGGSIERPERALHLQVIHPDDTVLDTTELEQALADLHEEDDPGYAYRLSEDACTIQLHWLGEANPRFVDDLWVVDGAEEVLAGALGTGHVQINFERLEIAQPIDLPAATTGGNLAEEVHLFNG